MTETERLRKVLRQGTVDRPPVTSMMVSVTTDFMDGAGVKLPEAHHNPELMARLAGSAYEIAGVESIKLPFDLTVEAEAMGAKIDFGTMFALPQVKEHPYDAPEEIPTAHDFLSKARVPTILEAIQLARRRYEDRIPVISSIVGPLTLSSMLFGFENLFLWMMTDPEKYSLVLERVTERCILYAREQQRVGSHVVQIADPSSTGDLISSEQYEKFVFPYHQELCSALDSPKVLHICGNITGHLKHVARLKVNGLSFEDKTEVKEAVKSLKGKIALVGYVPTSLLLNGSPNEVYRYSRECLLAGVDILNPGCALSIETPLENIRRMVLAAKEL